MIELNLLPKSENAKIDLWECSEDNFKNSFPHFFWGVWMLGVALTEGKDSFGIHLTEWAYRLQEHKRTLTVAPRLHLKTTVNLGYLAWHLYRLDRRYMEWDYMSYTEDLAEHQLKRGKRILSAIPLYFDNIKDITDAQSKWHYKIGNDEFVCEPSGIMAFKRGKHPYGMILDDVLRDPRSAVQMSILQEISRVFNEEIESMPTDELHIFGTPQDSEDLFYEIEKKPRFNCKRYRAITNYDTKSVLWPQIYPYETLKDIRKSIGDKAFNKEFQCSPVRSEEGFFMQEELDAVINPKLKNRRTYEHIKLNEYCYGGLDIGKKRHPSHLSVFGKDRRDRLIQLISLWMDGEDYNKQLDRCREIIENYKLFRLYYDDTRAEFESFNETGALPSEMVGITFTQKMKGQIAVGLERRVINKEIMFINDDRQKRQLLNVDNDLKSLETSGGHGDSFWSNALAVYAAEDSGVGLAFL